MKIPIHSFENPLIIVEVNGIEGTILEMVAGYHHTCILLEGGQVLCWGLNNHGQLGDGSFEDRCTPTPVTGLGAPVVGLGVGGTSTCAAFADQPPRCWGGNSSGQLGDGSSQDSSIPLEVIGLDLPVTKLVSGQEHSCSLLQGGQIWCWGRDEYGQLGDGTRSIEPVGQPLAGLPPGNLKVAAGTYHACAITSGSTVTCWGKNGHGQLGNGNTASFASPVQVLGLVGDAFDLAVGNDHTCALLDGGSVRCWGNNSHGQLGDGTTEDSTQPVTPVGLNSGVTVLGTGGNYSCAGLTEGGMVCWGDNSHGQLGDGTTENRLEPEPVLGIETQVLSIAAGYYHTCAVDIVGITRCWGSNYYGQLGNDSTETSLEPVEVAEFQSAAIPLMALGFYHSCGVDVGGVLKCWGENHWGQLGTGDTEHSSLPTAVVGLGVAALDVSAGYYHTCTLLDGGEVRCWGMNYLGMLGTVDGPDSTLPISVPGLEAGVEQISSGSHHNCALLDTGHVKCWGPDGLGQVTGDGLKYILPHPAVGFQQQ